MTEQEAIRQFIDQVKWLYEPEYGDFKRKVNLYLERLEEQQPNLKSGPAGRQVLTKIKNRVVFCPNGNIESTRREIMAIARELLERPDGSTH